MAEYIYNVTNETSKLDWAFPFQRTGAFPIDRSSVFSSLEDAQNYATGEENDERKLGGTSYVGQIISVYNSADKDIDVYVITENRTLKKVGFEAIYDKKTATLKLF